MSRRPGKVTLRKLAGAGYSRLLGLSALEALLALTWSFLLYSLAGLVVSNHALSLPLWYVVACLMVSLLERLPILGEASPLRALGMLQLNARGEAPGFLRVFVRVLLTPPCLLVLTLGLVPAGLGRSSVPEAISGIRLVRTIPALDPRNPETIYKQRGSILGRVFAYALLSLAAAGTVASLPRPSIKLGTQVAVRDTLRTMVGPDRELLRSYLELSALYPDSIEYHVRLASLYYRNDMRQDLRNELLQIRRLDPHHPMLLLGEDVDLSFRDLLVHEEGDGSEMPGSVGVAEATPFYSHSPANDRLLFTGPANSQMSTGGPAPEDSVDSSLLSDSIVSAPPDTTALDEPSDSATAAEPSVPLPTEGVGAGDTLQPAWPEIEPVEDAESNL
jgi:hypothetical protein